MAFFTNIHNFVEADNDYPISTEDTTGLSLFALLLNIYKDEKEPFRSQKNCIQL